MKLKKALLFSFLMGTITVLLASCGSTSPIPKEWQEQYPLTDYVEVIESNKSQKELFDSVRSYLIDNFKGGALDNYAWRDHDSTDMIKFCYQRDSNAGNFKKVRVGGVTAFTVDISIEFKENRMRFAMRNVKLAEYGYGLKEQWHAQGWNNLKLRQIGYEAYKELKEELVTNLHKVADGTLSSW